MKIDTDIFASSPSGVAALAREAEECGFDCLWFGETKHDPFVQLSLAAGSTKKVMLGTSIALAFTRSPTTLAYTAWDIQALSSGRLILGLGSQVKGHIERRFGVKWEKPVAKMREVVMALRAVWDSWQTGAPLRFNGRFYRLDLMTPFFSPGPIGSPRIPIYLAGVNEGMCALAGEVADGLHVHPLHTPRYLREVVSVAMAKGLAKGKRRREDISVTASVFVAVGRNEAQLRELKGFYRNQIAFYASTRSYRRVMEVHGWGEICDSLHALSMKGEWRRMGEEITDDVLAEFVVEADWKDVASVLERRYGGLVDRVKLYAPFDGSSEWKSLVAGFGK